MTKPLSWRRVTVALAAALALLVAPLVTSTAHAGGGDATAKARQHFQKGKQLFEAGKFRGAIAQFAAADKLAPAPVLEFNIALCYERLGERGEAVRRYRHYLTRVPDAPNRDAVEQKVEKLEGEMKAAARPAPAPAPAPPPPPESGPDGAGPDAAAAGGALPDGAEPPPAGQGDQAGQEGAGDADQSASRTGDPDLDRVAAIDIGKIQAARDGRAGAAPPPAGQAGGGAAAGTAQLQQSPPTGGDATAPPPAPAGASAHASAPPPEGEHHESKPIYKQWWFWVVAGVSAVILIDIATADSSSSSNQPARGLLLPAGSRGARQPGGAVLWRF